MDEQFDRDTESVAFAKLDNHHSTIAQGVFDLEGLNTARTSASRSELEQAISSSRSLNTNAVIQILRSAGAGCDDPLFSRWPRTEDC